MTRLLPRLALGTVLLLFLQGALLQPAQAERRSGGWRENHYGSRYNYRHERFRPLPRHGPPMRYRPQLDRRY